MTDDVIKPQSTSRPVDLALVAEHQGAVAEADSVVGTRGDLSFSGIKAPCSQCGADTYTNIAYPRRIKIICEICFVQSYEFDDEPGSEGSGQ